MKARHHYKYKYSFKEIAAFLGLQLGYVYNLAWKGKFEPSDFGSVVRYILERNKQTMTPELMTLQRSMRRLYMH